MLNILGKNKKKSTVNIDGSLAAKIPYICGYKEDGIIESSQGKYSKMYVVEELKVENISSFDIRVANQKIEQLLNSFPENVEFQFVVHNRLIEQNDYLKRILINPDSRGSTLKPLIEEYDHIIADNISIGHNNVHKTIYFVISVCSDVVDDARLIFKHVDEEIHENFNAVYGIHVKPLSLVERFHVLYSMFNPGQDDFGRSVDFKDTGDITPKNLKYMKMTSKDIVAPKSWNTKTSLLNYTILNEGTNREQYARVFFINSLPETISSSMISDLTNISSSMIFSTIYEPVDVSMGFGISADFVAKNTFITQKRKRDTVAERKRHETISVEIPKIYSEKEYFNKQALNVFKEARAREEKILKCTFTVLLYADTLEELDRDSDLLRISATKFASSVKCLDLLQLQGFQTCLPLCHSRIDVSRFMDIRRLAAISPINIQDVARKGGVFVGLNAINDNLILANRKNNANLNGFIAGTEHSGKTYQNKREIFNALISTEDKVNVITVSDEYDDFANLLGGRVLTSARTDPFEMVADYGLTKDGSVFKAYFLEAFVSSLHGTALNYEENDIYKRSSEIEQEVNTLVKYIKDEGLNGTESIISFIEENKIKYHHVKDGLLKMGKNYYFTADKDRRDTRLTVYKIKDSSEMLLVLDYLWNRNVEEKKQNISNWIFIDPIDSILKDASVSAYLSEYMTNADLFQTIFTVVIQDAVQLFNHPVTGLALEDIVIGSGYAKLMNTGPIERKRFAELLNIPNALLPFISNVEPGKGVIITSASNIAFDDSFLEEDCKFRKMFAKNVKHIKYF